MQICGSKRNWRRGHATLCSAIGRAKRGREPLLIRISSKKESTYIALGGGATPPHARPLDGGKGGVKLPDPFLLPERHPLVLAARRVRQQSPNGPWTARRSVLTGGVVAGCGRRKTKVVGGLLWWLGCCWASFENGGEAMLAGKGCGGEGSGGLV